MSRLGRVVAASLLAAACTTNVAPTNPPSDESPPGPTATAAPVSDASPPVDGPVPVATKPLAETLAYLPAEASQVDFTNWSLMLATEGLPSPGSRLTEEQRRDFLGRLFRDHATPSAFAYHKLYKHRAAWGWDNTDLDWEVTVHVGQRRAHLLRLPAELTVAELEKRFTDFGFTREQRDDVVLFTTQLDPRSDWLRDSDPAMANSALLADDHLLIVAADRTVLDQVLAARTDRDRSLASLPGAAAAAAGAGTPIAATLFVEEAICSQWVPYWFGPADHRLLRAYLPQLGQYDALAVGYQRGDDGLVGSIAMGYADQADAEWDLDARLLLADGPALRHDAVLQDLDLSDLYFALVDGRREGSAIVLLVEPVRNQPRVLFDMAHSGDMIFAMC